MHPTSTIPLRKLPTALRHIPQPPHLLYTEGDVSLLESECVSIVGSRKMSLYGREVIHRIVPGLVSAGLTVVSGLAYGVDAEAHRVTLSCGGRGIAVLGTSLEMTYPASHWSLRQRLLTAGSLVLSEYAPGVVPQKYHFPERNRIIAALGKVTLIVEAGEKSGSLSTAQAALEANQVVCVIPGDITREGSLGALRLLKQGAEPVTSAEDILQHYQHLPPTMVEQLPLRGCS